MWIVEHGLYVHVENFESGLYFKYMCSSSQIVPCSCTMIEFWYKTESMFYITMLYYAVQEWH